MGIFDGLGRGVASAALGAQTGEIKGEAAARQRELQDLSNQYRLGALAAKKKELDPNKQTRDFARQAALELAKHRYDPELLGFFKDHPEAADQYDARITHASGVANGTIPASQFDIVHFGQLLNNHPAIPPPATGELPITDTGAQPLPGGRSETPPVIPEISPGMVIQGGAFHEPTVIPQASGLTPATGPQTPLYETPKQRTARLAAEARQAGLGIRGALAGAQIPLLGQRTIGETQKNQARPAQAAATLGKTKAGTTLAQEQTRASQVLTPVKAAVGKSTIQHQRVSEQQGGQRIAETGRHNQAAETIQQQRANIDNARQQDTSTYHGALIDAARFRINNFPATERGRNLRAKLAADVKGLSSVISLPGGLKVPAAAGKADQWSADLDATLKAMDAEETKAAKGGGSVSYSGQVKNAPPALGLGSGSAPPAAKLAPEALSTAKAIIGNPQRDNVVASLKKRHPDVYDHFLRAYQQIKGRPYAPGVK